MIDRARSQTFSRIAAVGAALGLLPLLIFLHAEEKKKLSVYSAQGSYAVSVTEHDGKDYVSLQELLQPLGGQLEMNGKKLKLKLAQAEAECEAGKSSCKVQGNQVALSGNPIVEGSRFLIPLHSVPAFISSLTDSRFDFHERTRRLFVGSYGTHFTAEVAKGEPAAVVFNFSAPVNPAISTDSGALKMTFNQDAVNSGLDAFNFDHPVIKSATYSESNGNAEVVVHGSAPLIATFSNGGKTISIAPAPAQAAQLPSTAPVAEAPPQSAESHPAEAAPAKPPPALVPFLPKNGRFIVVLDAAHGGDDPGAKLSEKISEKDVTIQVARRLRYELQNRGVMTVMVRDTDQNPALDDRAASANSARATLYIALHASTSGNGINVYSPILSGSSREAKPGGFIPWENAQAISASNSKAFAQGVVDQLHEKKLPGKWVPVPLRPLSNVLGMAIAVEIEPAPEKDGASLSNGNYQQSIAIGLANSILGARQQLEEER